MQPPRMKRSTRSRLRRMQTPRSHSPPRTLLYRSRHWMRKRPLTRWRLKLRRPTRARLKMRTTRRIQPPPHKPRLRSRKTPNLSPWRQPSCRMPPPPQKLRSRCRSRLNPRFRPLTQRSHPAGSRMFRRRGARPHSIAGYCCWADLACCCCLS